MKDNKYYTCEYCYNEFEPNRRRVQKYCSNTCRSKAFHAKKNTNKDLTIIKSGKDAISNPASTSKNKVEEMSFAGVGNSMFGTLAADGIIDLFTPDAKKPATKGDLYNLIYKINQRYHRVMNLPNDQNGHSPYFDLNTNTITYLKY